MAIVVQNLYFVHPGKEAEALEVRRAASQVRADAGRPTGRILVTLQRPSSAPTFIWECDYPDLATREQDMAWAEGSPEFRAIQDRMGTLLDAFERVVFEVDSR